MQDYYYARHLIASLGCFDIPHPMRKDIYGKQITVMAEVNDALSKQCTVNHDGEECIITFEDELSADERVILNGLVQKHKNNE